MNKFAQVVVVLAAGFAATLAVAAEGDLVASPAKRQETLAMAKKLLATREITPVTDDPFHSAAFYEMVAGLGHVPGVPSPGGTTSPVGPRTDRDLLQAMAASLKPSGNFDLGGQRTLIFGQKRVKAGNSLTITFEGTEYILEVTNIDRTSFTLRLNREEFTRPIK